MPNKTSKRAAIWLSQCCARGLRAVRAYAAGASVTQEHAVFTGDSNWALAFQWLTRSVPALESALTWPSANGAGLRQWDENDDGLTPLDVASQVAVPEFDGRIITSGGPELADELEENGYERYTTAAAEA